MVVRMKIAIVGGGGASGLTTIRAFQKIIHDTNILQQQQQQQTNQNNGVDGNCIGDNDHEKIIIEVVAFEKSNSIGGVWNYHNNEKNNNKSTTRTKKNHPMYRTLRTNLPKELMSYREHIDWPQSLEQLQNNKNNDDKFSGSSTKFATNSSANGNISSFVHHTVVLEYLKSYAKRYNLVEKIQFGCTVQKLTILKQEENTPMDHLSSSTTTPTENTKNGSSCTHQTSSIVLYHDDPTPTTEEENTFRSTNFEMEILPKIELEWTTSEEEEQQKHLQQRNTSNDRATSIETNGCNNGSITKRDVFDGVIVCNGHYNKPFVPTIPGLDEYFHGTIIHSIEYDNDDKLYEHLHLKYGKTVLCIGARASGTDLAREIAQKQLEQYTTLVSLQQYQQQKQTNQGINGDDKDNKYNRGYDPKIIVEPPPPRVYLSDSTYKESESMTEYNVTLVPRTKTILANGCVEFDCNCKEQPHIDTIVFCSGYDYDFPFIIQQQTGEQQQQQQHSDDATSKNHSILPLSTTNRCVKPVYKQLWHATSPNVAFIGLPYSIVPFPLFEIQAQAVAYQWTEWIRRRCCCRQYIHKDNDENMAQQQMVLRLPNVTVRTKEAYLDSISGGPIPYNGRIPQDTHFLGNYQWDYCRTIAKFANQYNTAMEQFLITNEQMYNDVSNKRNMMGIVQAGPDTYRSFRYERKTYYETNHDDDTTTISDNIANKERCYFTVHEVC